MATDQKGIQSAGIGLFHRRMLGKFAELAQRGWADAEQLAHLAGPVDRSRHDPLGQQQGVKLPLGLRPEVGWRDRFRNATKTAGEAVFGVQSRDPHPEHPLRRIVAA